MGTRALVMLVSEGAPKIAQYVHCDGYPEGAGLDVLEFCKDKLHTQIARNTLRRALRNVFFNQTSLDLFTTERDRLSGHGPSSSMSSRVETILRLVAENKGGMLELVDNSALAGDSLMIEFGYVIDLDLGQLEVYVGFNLGPMHPLERFANVTRTAEDQRLNGTYRPLRVCRIWPLGSLPDKQQMLECFATPSSDNAGPALLKLLDGPRSRPWSPSPWACLEHADCKANLSLALACARNHAQQELEQAQASDDPPGKDYFL